MKIKEYKENLIYAIKNLKGNIIENLSVIMPALVVAISIVIYLLEYISFVFKGGYGKQINILKSYGIDGIEQAFTLGHCGTVIERVDTLIISFVMIVGVCFMMYMIIIKQESWKRKFIIVDIVVLTVMGVLYFLFDMLNRRKIPLTENQEKALVRLMFVSNINGIPLLFILFAVLFVIVVGILLYFVLRSEYRYILKMLCIAGVLSYIGSPLLFLLLKNIIPLISGIVALILIALVILFVIKMLISGLSTDGGASVKNSNSSSMSRMEAKSKVKEKPQKKKEYNFDTTFWRDRGGYGVGVPQADCIYMKNTWGGKTYVCTVLDFEKGDVAIINKKVRVMDVAGCKEPER